MAWPLRGGSNKEKITFFETFFFILSPFKNKNYLGDLFTNIISNHHYSVFQSTHTLENGKEF